MSILFLQIDLNIINIPTIIMILNLTWIQKYNLLAFVSTFHSAHRLFTRLLGLYFRFFIINNRKIIKANI